MLILLLLSIPLIGILLISSRMYYYDPKPLAYTSLPVQSGYTSGTTYVLALTDPVGALISLLYGGLFAYAISRGLADSVG